jgi:hypothetical protein
MAAGLTAVKLCVCAAGGALIGGAAVHVVEKPRRVAVKQVSKPRPAVRRAAARAAPVPPPPCLPMMTPALAVQAPAAVFATDRVRQAGPIASAASILPIGALVPIGDGAAPAPGEGVRAGTPVPEPALLGLFGLGFATLVASRRRPQG